jgi:phenylpyruvate tautomerase PptA (4-oxalocrotonate tautomerase family)
MPLVQVKLIEASTPTEKKAIVTKHRDALVSIEKHNNPSWGPG